MTVGVTIEPQSGVWHDRAPEFGPGLARVGRGYHGAMSDEVDPADVETDGGPLDTDDVAERRHTERHGGDDVDEAARRSSGFDLDEDDDEDRSGESG